MTSQPNMVFCRGCAKEIHESAISCPACGCIQHPANTEKTTASVYRTISLKDDPNTKFHLALILSASIAVVLLYATMAIPFIGIATGLSFGLSARLYAAHQKNQFAGTKKLDWVLLASFSGIAFILMLAGAYDIQAPVLVFVAVRALMMYFTMNTEVTEANQSGQS